MNIDLTNAEHAAIIFLYIILGIVFFGVITRVKLQGGELFGQPTINKALQFTGKFLIILPAGILFLQAAGFNFRWLNPPVIIKWIGLFLFFESIIFLCFSLIQLGRFTKMGLPKNDQIRLQTSGIYKISRNPMYLGLMLLAISSVMYVPNPVNFIAAASGIIIHHRIVLNEEKFLSSKFGEAYKLYLSRTNRYF